MSIFKVTTDSTGTILDRSRAPDCLSPVSQLAIIVGHVLAESTTVIAVVGTAVMTDETGFRFDESFEPPLFCHRPN